MQAMTSMAPSERGTTCIAASVVALDLNTGQYTWHFQEVHHDVWDYDGRRALSYGAAMARSTAGGKAGICAWADLPVCALHP